ncbi:MAG: PilW family protein [Gammaproteobacteria bacterium]|nr:PilW family protein [Gammaproteobacteria bacterium]
MKNTDFKKRQQGMTLVEIMIALVLGAFLLGGVMQIFLSSKQTYQMQDGMSRLQENGRFAMDFLTRDIRMADYWGCIRSASLVESNLNAGSEYDNFNNGISGTNDDNGGNDADADNDENGNAIWDGTDTISLRGAFGADIFVVNIPATTSADLKVTDDSELNENDVLLVSDCTAGDIFQVTNDPGTGGAAGKDEVVHNTGGIPAPGDPDYPGNFEKMFQKIYETDAQIYRLTFVTYSIRDSGGEPTLSRSINGAAIQSLVEGIENMQILYGEDTDGDLTPDYYVDADAVADMERVVSIRITLTVRTLSTNLSTTSVDGRLRRTFSTTIAVRNRLI